MGTEKDPKSPATTSMAYDYMLPHWIKVDTVLGGTESMRSGAYTPQHSEESDGAYTDRVENTTLLNITEMTLNTWVGKPFSEPMQLEEDVPADIVAMTEDIDLQGNNLDVFCRRWFRDGLAKGFSHVMVEFPQRTVPVNEDGTERPRTLADDRAENLRPYWVPVAPERLIFAHSQVVGGVEQLLEVRIMSEEIVQVGFAEEVRKQILRYLPGVKETWELRKGQRKKEEWVMVESITYDLPFIPLVTFYATREGFMCCKPPLLDLANLNIRHFNSYSDQIAILTTARFPMLALSGGMDDDGKLKVGPNTWLYTPDPQGEFYYVEHDGKAIQSGRDELQDLEAQMASYGAEFLKKRPGNPTATARALDSAEALSPLQEMALRFKDSVERALQYTAIWMRLGDDAGGQVVINSDFGLDEIEAVAVDAVTKARQQGDISRDMYLEELMRRGILSEDFDLKANKAGLEDEAAEALVTMEKTTAITNPPEEPGGEGDDGGGGFGA